MEWREEMQQKLDEVMARLDDLMAQWQPKFGTTPDKQDQSIAVIV